MNTEDVSDRTNGNIQIFMFNDQNGKYEKVIPDPRKDFPLYKLLHSENIFMFIEHTYSRVWIWFGLNTSTRMKFIAAKLAPKMRDWFGTLYKISSVDEGNETRDFKMLIGLETSSDFDFYH